MIDTTDRPLIERIAIPTQWETVSPRTRQRNVRRLYKLMGNFIKSLPDDVLYEHGLDLCDLYEYTGREEIK